MHGTKCSSEQQAKSILAAETNYFGRKAQCKEAEIVFWLITFLAHFKKGCSLAAPILNGKKNGGYGYITRHSYFALGVFLDFYFSSLLLSPSPIAHRTFPFPLFKVTAW